MTRARALVLNPGSDIDWLWIVGLNLATLAVCVLAMILPSFIISRIQPAKAIKYE